LEHDFGEQVDERFEMAFRFTAASKPKGVAIMASKDDHCLLGPCGRTVAVNWRCRS
jgi:formyltetrahydrofolate deformylase